MALWIKISRRAAEQVRDASRWWVENRPAAPGAVAADFSAAVLLLAEQPGIGAEYRGSRTPGVRRLYLGRVRYFVYYKVVGEILQVLAFWHANRGPQPEV